MESNKKFKILIPDLIKPPAEIERKILSDIGDVVATEVIESVSYTHLRAHET